MAHATRRSTIAALAACIAVWGALAPAGDPRIASIDAALETMVARRDVAGAAAAVLRHDGILHLDGVGFADLGTQRPMTADTMCWIASMTKPLTGIAILMLQDEGLLDVDDEVAKYVPDFGRLRGPSGRPARLTIKQLLTHTSGLGEASGPAAADARTLADLVPIWLAARMKHEPGERWTYTQSGINLAGRIVEVVGGKPFDVFLQERLFNPLGMRNTTFYPSDAQRAATATAYARNADTGTLEPVPPRTDYGDRARPPQGNGGLYSTARDYARLCLMLLNRGSLDGRRYLSDAAVEDLSSVHTGDLPVGFLQAADYGARTANYGWGLGACVLKTPHDGVAAMLSPGTFGHGGAWGTQAWIDPVRDVAYVLMVQRSNFPNSDASEVRRVFQQAAADALAVVRWPLAHDAKAGKGPSAVVAEADGEARGVRFGQVAGCPAASFDGAGAHVTIPNGDPLRLGRGDFTITAWVHTEQHVDDDLGDILAHFDPASRTGLHLGLRTNAGVTSSQANDRQLQFGIDAGTEPVFTDEGRPGNAVFGQSMAVHDGRLYVGSCVTGSDQAGHVHRYEGPGRWTDCGAPDKANSITAMAAWNGSLYVGSGKYRLAGTRLAESPNAHTGGRVFRLRTDDTWELVGELPGVEAVGGMVVFRGKLLAGSLYKPAALFRHDGDGRWTALPLPDGKRVVTMGLFNGHLHATSYDNGNVYRFDGTTWADLGPVGDATQDYSFAVHRGRLQVSTWPSGRVFEREGDAWADKGRLGDEREVMGMLVHNGCLYGGTLPLAQIYRHAGGRAWTLLKQLDTTPAVEYRRVWSMAQHDGRLFATTIPSGHVWSMRTGACVTWDKPFPPGWRHVAAQRAGGGLRLFVDGVPVAESRAAGADTLDIDSDQPWTIGAGSGDFFHGALADVHLYRRALSGAELAAAAAAGPLDSK